MGGHGYSLRLEGLERGINDNANQRDIVIHGAAYVSEGLIRAQGYLGRSQGCPALPEKLHKPIIDKIKNGSCLFIYGKDKSYPGRSKIGRPLLPDQGESPLPLLKNYAETCAAGIVLLPALLQYTLSGAAGPMPAVLQ